MNTKQVGIIIVGISIVLLVVMVSFIKDLQTTIRGQCACGPGACPMENNLPVQGYLGITLSVVIGIFGAILILTSKKTDKLVYMKSERIREMLKTLNEDQRKVYDLIEGSDGVVFQSELVEKSGFSKVKVSRVLDKLEGKGLVERRRRGMSNIVLTKKS